MSLYKQFHLLGSSFRSKGAAKATMIGDRNCSTTESDNGISCMDVYNRKMDMKLHSPLKTSILCLHTMRDCQNKLMNGFLCMPQSWHWQCRIRLT